MKRRGGFTKVELVIVIVILLILAAILLPIFFTGERGRSSRRQQCSSNLKQIGLAMQMYVQENDGHFSAVAFNNVTQSLPPYAKPFGWSDALQPYLKSTKLFQCPSLKNLDRPDDATQKNFTDYWFNSNLSSAQMKYLVSPSMTIMCGDGNNGTDQTDARYNLNALPQAWRDTERSPARRHPDTANYLFADGHVRSHKPETITNLPTSQSNSTFSIR